MFIKTEEGKLINMEQVKVIDFHNTNKEQVKVGVYFNDGMYMQIACVDSAKKAEFVMKTIYKNIELNTKMLDIKLYSPYTG